MDFILNSLSYIIPFLIVLTILVFVHELGHFLVARYNGVKVEVFSIGFGKELFGFTDKHGTRWRFALIPIGGYVQMFGTMDAASTFNKKMPKKDQPYAFPYKRVGQRAAIVAAGPIANYLLAVIIFCIVFLAYGYQYTSPTISQVVEGSAAQTQGLKTGDLIKSIDGKDINRFQDIQRTILLGLGKPMNVVVERQGKEKQLSIKPEMKSYMDNFGNPREMPVLGIVSGEIKTEKVSVISAVGHAFQKVYEITADTIRALGQVIIGARGTDELGGPIKIAQLSKETAKGGLQSFLHFIAILSVNLGLINLFPIPVLDGGHLVFYSMEALRGKPLNQKLQSQGVYIGFALLMALMVFVTWNDLAQMKFFDFLKSLIS